MFEKKEHIEVEHISLARKADLILVVPATANIIGKVANGIADDMLSTTIMATTAKVVFAPAMNNEMYNNKIVQDNIKKLKKYGYKIVKKNCSIPAWLNTRAEELGLNFSKILQEALIEKIGASYSSH